MLSDKAIGITFFISLMGHCVFLSLPLFDTLFSQAQMIEEINIKLEIEKPRLLPKIDKLGEEKKLKEIKEAVIEDSVGDLRVSQEKIEVMNPTQEAMLRYQDMVKQKIQEVRRYPLWAKKQEFQGVVHITFVVLSNGEVKNVIIKNSSGFNILNNEALATIKRASPFSPFPEGLKKPFLEMEVSVVFRLK